MIKSRTILLLVFGAALLPFSAERACADNDFYNRCMNVFRLAFEDRGLRLDEWQGPSLTAIWACSAPASDVQSAMKLGVDEIFPGLKLAKDADFNATFASWKSESCKPTVKPDDREYVLWKNRERVAAVSQAATKAWLDCKGNPGPAISELARPDISLRTTGYSGDSLYLHVSKTPPNFPDLGVPSVHLKISGGTCYHTHQLNVSSDNVRLGATYLCKRERATTSKCPSSDYAKGGFKEFRIEGESRLNGKRFKIPPHRIPESPLICWCEGAPFAVPSCPGSDSTEPTVDSDVTVKTGIAAPEKHGTKPKSGEEKKPVD